MKIKSFLASAAAACVLACVAALAHAQGDPPSRVAGLDYFSGTVTFAPAGSSNWSYATLNRPMTTGDSLWTTQGARAEMHIGSTALRMNGQTSLSLLNVSDQNVQLKVTQGTLNLRLREYNPGQPYEIDTPNLAFVPQRAGDYRIDVDPAGTTRVTVWRGAGTAYGDQASLAIGDGQQVQFDGTSLEQIAGTAQPTPDAFDAWADARDRREDDSVSARYVSRDMTGYESLDQYGTWEDVPDYGSVWIPTTVTVGWAPYRTGHWAWVAPWGWTWIDDEPWGFAPFHYGRWAYIVDRWCWVPGPVVARPVYAPALVAWVGGAAGVSVGVSIVSGGPGVAWFPLGPGEAYHPAYRASPTYVTNINKTVIVNNTTIINRNVVNTAYVNQHVRNAITAVPASAFVQGQPVARAATALRPDAANHMRIAMAPGVAPVARSLVGNSRPAQGAVPAGVFTRPVVATRAPAPIARPSSQLTENLRPVPNAGGRPLTLNNNAPARVSPHAANVRLLTNVPQHPAPSAGNRPAGMPGQPGVINRNQPGGPQAVGRTPQPRQSFEHNVERQPESNVPHPPQAPSGNTSAPMQRGNSAAAAPGHGQPARGEVQQPGRMPSPAMSEGRGYEQPGRVNAERAMHENRAAIQPENRPAPRMQPERRPAPQAPAASYSQPYRAAQPPRQENERPAAQRPMNVPHPSQPHIPQPQPPHPQVVLQHPAPHPQHEEAKPRRDEHPHAGSE